MKWLKITIKVQKWQVPCKIVNLVDCLDKKVTETREEVEALLKRIAPILKGERPEVPGNNMGSPVTANPHGVLFCRIDISIDRLNDLVRRIREVSTRLDL